MGNAAVGVCYFLFCYSFSFWHASVLRFFFHVCVSLVVVANDKSGNFGFLSVTSMLDVSHVGMFLNLR